MSINEQQMLQNTLYYLEEYKRNLGRQFDRAHEHSSKCQLLAKYNNVENQIRQLVDTYGLKRQSQPYKLSLEELK